MPTNEKIDRVEELKDRIERSTITLAADYSGISVNQMTELRRSMRAAGIEFTIVKNTLTYLAAEEAQRPQVKDIVQGPTALAFGYDDPVDAAMTQNGDTAPLLMAGNNFLELRNDSFFQLLKVLSPFDLKSFNIIQPFFERVRKPFVDFPDA